MGVNPETNKFEPLTEDTAFADRIGSELFDPAAPLTRLLRLDGTPAPSHWSVFTVGELVTIKDYTFRVAYIGETAILLEPVKPTDALKGEQL